MIEHKIKKDEGVIAGLPGRVKRSMKTRRIYVPQLRTVFLFYKGKTITPIAMKKSVKLNRVFPVTQRGEGEPLVSTLTRACKCISS